MANQAEKLNYAYDRGILVGSGKVSAHEYATVIERFKDLEKKYYLLGQMKGLRKLKEAQGVR